ncbi:hypothetical protein D3C72_2233280 [compost metagenome]
MAAAVRIQPELPNSVIILPSERVKMSRCLEAPTGASKMRKERRTRLAATTAKICQ